jgi:lysophospholipid acyltransferase (LPLAT)-like uncharacterized protein
LTEVFQGRPPAKILLEASTESEWVAALLESLGHEVIGGGSQHWAAKRQPSLSTSSF